MQLQIQHTTPDSRLPTNTCVCPPIQPGLFSLALARHRTTRAFTSFNYLRVEQIIEGVWEGASVFAWEGVPSLQVDVYARDSIVPVVMAAWVPTWWRIQRMDVGLPIS